MFNVSTCVCLDSLCARTPFSQSSNVILQRSWPRFHQHSHSVDSAFSGLPWYQTPFAQHFALFSLLLFFFSSLGIFSLNFESVGSASFTRRHKKPQRAIPGPQALQTKHHQHFTRRTPKWVEREQKRPKFRRFPSSYLHRRIAPHDTAPREATLDHPSFFYSPSPRPRHPPSLASSHLSSPFRSKPVCLETVVRRIFLKLHEVEKRTTQAVSTTLN